MSILILKSDKGKIEIINLDQVLFIGRSTEYNFALNFHFPGLTYQSFCHSEEDFNSLIENIIEAMK